MTLATPRPETTPAQASFTQSALWIAGTLLLGIAIYISGWKPIGISADIRNYELLYNASAISDWRSIFQGNDSGYFALAKLAAAWGWSFDLFAFALAASTCGLLAVVVYRIRSNRIVLVTIYASYLFWLHEYTQIRIAAAIAIGLYAIYVARPRVRWTLFILALLLHNSFIIVVAVYVMIRVRRIELVAAVAAIILLLLLLGPLASMSRALIERIVTYQDLASTTGQFTSINLLSLMPLVQIAGICLAAIHIRELPSLAKEELIFSCVGVAAFYVLSSLPVLAFRTFELFMPFFVILLSRLWRLSVVARGLILFWILLGLRSAFFTADSVVIL